MNRENCHWGNEENNGRESDDGITSWYLSRVTILVDPVYRGSQRGSGRRGTEGSEVAGNSIEVEIEED